MKKRGKILRDTALGPGLLMIEGRQYRYSLEHVWKSEAPPRPGLVVDAELDSAGVVQSITVVSDAQLAREHAEATAERVRRSPAVTQQHNTALYLAAAGLLAAGWFFLAAASVYVPFPGRVELTFWQILGSLSADPSNRIADLDNPTAPLWGFAAAVALAGPFLHRFWNTRAAALAGLLPLVFMTIVALAFRRSMTSISPVSPGAGAYLSALIGIYFAFTSVQGLAAARTAAVQPPKTTERKAA